MVRPPQNQTERRKDMKTAETTLSTVAAGLGTAMVMAWFLVLGPIGFLLLVVMAYAMVVQNLALGVVCGLPLAFPFVVTALWIPFGWGAALQEKWAEESAEVPGSETANETVRGN
jgi:hypothetical protein